jgi:hypothetical protein
MRWITCYLAIGAALAQAPPTASPREVPFDIEVPGRDFWVDTGLDLRPGDEISLKAAGTLELANGQKVSAAGAARGWRDLLRSYPVNQAGQGALIGRLGESGRPFLVGVSSTYAAERAGRLFLEVNKAGNDAPKGSFTVTIGYVSRAPEVTEVKEHELVEITTEIVDRFPRRITDAQGNPGDNTNFVIVGPGEKILKTLAAAGWVEVDRSNQDAVISGILAVLSKNAYLTLPMSELMLFDRVQDHGMAHAEPIAVVAERHHFRIWKAPFDVDGEEIWVGAGTHDIGFERDQRNNGVTHKIDPNIDLERDYIGKSMEETGQVARLSYVMPSEPSMEAVTATGGSYHSDGRLLVIHLIPDAKPEGPPGGREGAPENPEEQRSIFEPPVAEPSAGRRR